MIALDAYATGALAVSIAAAFAIAASLAAVRVATRLLPADEAALAVPIGLAAAPLLLGILAVLALAALPGWSYALHAATTAALVAAVAIGCGRSDGSSWRTSWRASGPIPLWSLLPLACLWLAALAYPPTVNDAVEYALATRDLLVTHDLRLSYPALDGDRTPSGFFFGWTHPPTFVALRYLLSGGSADAVAGVSTRLLGPWLVTATLPALAATAGRCSSSARAMAPSLALATPLYFLGATTGLIDPLMVLAGTLAFVAVEHLGRRHPERAGVLLGAALWSHSVAVLLLPLAAGRMVVERLLVPSSPEDGATQAPSLLRTTAGVARLLWPTLVIAWPPYAWNLARTGRLVSDAPAVVLRDPQAWETFYDFSRGLSSAAARVQYGLLKGLFAPEAYGITGLLACLALILLLRRWRTADRDTRAGLPTGAAWWPIAFVAGSSITMLAGTNVLVRNERMLLLVLGPSAVLAAWVFASLDDAGRGGRGLVRRGGRAIGALVVAAPLLLAAYSLRSARAALDDAGVPGGIGWLNAHASPHDRALSFRPGDFVYSGVRVMTHLDPVLLPVYHAVDAGTAARRLAELGVRWVHTAEPTPPTRYATPLDAVLADRGLAELVYSDASTQVYRLRPQGRAPDERGEVRVATIESVRNVLNVGGRKDVLAIPFAERRLTGGRQRVEAQVPWDLFERHLATDIRSEPFLAAGGSPDARPRASEAAVHWRVTGSGYVRAWIEYAAPAEDATGPVRHRAYLADVVLQPGTTADLTRRVMLPAGAQDLRLLMRLHGSGEVRPGRIELTLWDAHER